jgi:glucose-6-phosphate 1-dehydrogenase
MVHTAGRSNVDKSPGQRKAVDPCVLVIFGATGDLTGRKLMPALYNLAHDGQLPKEFACVAFARRDKSSEQFRAEMLAAAQEYSRSKPIDMELWRSFSERVFYLRSDFHEDAGYENLHKMLADLDQRFGTKGNRVYYLSTPPSEFPLVVEKLHQHNLIYKFTKVKDRWSRVIIEKPFGRDLKSAEALQAQLMCFLDERQVYRIDHYLGKETVQNLLVFRFSNPIFESLWNNHHVDHMQITVSEEIGIGTRGKFWEEAGMLRDIIQNHMMQLLSLVAMEPPTHLCAEAIHDEKVKVLESMRPISLDPHEPHAVRGQYGAGIVNGTSVKGYRQEDNVDPHSNVETYVALELFVDNWRWAGVPFYLRAGKHLPKRATEIAVVFKDAPGFLFKNHDKKLDTNVLVIRIQPDEGIALTFNCKPPGQTQPLQPVVMDFRYGTFFGATPPEAYERLICDCMAGESTLFARADEVLASWRLLTPLLEKWSSESPGTFPNYAAGSWGPSEAEDLIQASGRHWRAL